MILFAYFKKKSYLCSRNNKDNNSLKPKSRKGIKIMTYAEIRNRYNGIVEKYNAESTPLKYFEQDYDDLDVEIRDQFGVTEPIHLWENYCIGDADEEKLLNETGYEDIDKLFSDMDNAYLMQLDNAVDEYEQKMEEQFTNKCLSEAFAEFEYNDNHSEDFDKDIYRFSGASVGGYIVVDGVTYAKIRRPERIRIYDAFNQHYYANPFSEYSDNQLESEDGYQTGYTDFCMWKSDDRKKWEIM